MKALAGFLFKEQCRPLILYSRLYSSKKYEKIEGIRENFSEYEVRLYFDKWLKSLWLAPRQWVHSTHDYIRLTRHFVPFWNISIQGSIQCSLSTKSNLPFHHDENYYSHKEWHSFPLEIADVSLNNVNIYAAEYFDKYHVQKLDISFDNVELIDINNKDHWIEKATLDQKTAFNHAWILMIKPLLENMCLEKAKEIYPKFDDPRIDSFHLKILSKEERLLYYPIYRINYNYKSRFNYMCLFDGVTGFITGDRQYSFMKVTLATLIGFYPIIKIALFSFGSLADLLFAFELATDFSFIGSLPIALIVAPCVGFYAYSYPKSYNKGLSQVHWQQDQTKALKFTYESIDSIQQQKKQFISQDDIEFDSESKPIQTHHQNLPIEKSKKQDD